MTNEIAAAIAEEPLIKPRAPCDGVGILRDPGMDVNDDDTNAQSNRLFALLSWKRPFDSCAEEFFARHYIDTAHNKMQKDAFGNRHLHIGYPDGAPCRVMWSCHIDTCHHDEGYQRLALQKDKDDLLYVGVRRGEGSCLGADDGTGVWLLLEMIRKGKPGYYIFHRGEERGCLGSKWIKDTKPDLLKRLDAAIALDRRGFDNIITHMGGERGCSEGFAWAIGRQITDYKPDPTGAFTDTKQYFTIIPECTNLSVGYDMQHGPLEKQYIVHALQLRKLLLAMDLRSLPIVRDPKKVEYRYASSNFNRSGDYAWDKDNINPKAYTHKAIGPNKEETMVWSVEMCENIDRKGAVFVSGRGFILKCNLKAGDAIISTGSPVNDDPLPPLAPSEDNPSPSGTNDDDPTPEEDYTDVDGDEDVDGELDDCMLRDSRRSLLELCEDYPGAAATLIAKLAGKPFDLCCEIYGEEDYYDFAINVLDAEDEAADVGAGIIDPAFDATE